MLYLLVGQYRRLSKRMVQTIIKTELLNLSEDKEKNKEYHTHTLRHSGISLLYNENDIDIFILKRILGHESLEATQVYTHISNKKLKYIMENCAISSLIEQSMGVKS